MAPNLSDRQLVSFIAEKKEPTKVSPMLRFFNLGNRKDLIPQLQRLVTREILVYVEGGYIFNPKFERFTDHMFNQYGMIVRL